jgi:coronamic acid synthetase CmaT thioesterase component
MYFVAEARSVSFVPRHTDAVSSKTTWRGISAPSQDGDISQRIIAEDMSAPALSRPWLVRVGDTARPGLRICCFPFGGGGAGPYWPWRSRLPETVEICAVRLPGRENRIREPNVTDPDVVVTQVVHELELLPRVRTVFFGHSMGAALACETAHRLRTQGSPMPALLIASGRLPPHLDPVTGWADRDDEALLTHLIDMGGVPLASSQARALLRPQLAKIRADFRLNDALAGRVRPPFDFPISTVNGSEDPLVDAAGLAEWRQCTRGELKAFLVPGGHFALQTEAAQFLEIVSSQLEPLVERRVPT